MSLAVWQVTIAALLAVLAFDLALAVIRRNKETSIKEAAAWTFFYVSAAIAFGYSLGVWNTTQARGEFFAGWITEYSLSVDNLFIFILILARFKVDKTKQQLVLLVGIIMALVLRGIFIALGSAAISRFSWVFYIFGAFLLFTAYKLISEADEKEWKEGKLITWFRKKGASPLTIVLVAIAFTDLIFALDSIPAIFGLTKDPYIVFTANAFALMGLRQLYFLLSGLMQRLKYLGVGLSIILAWIGVKLVNHALHKNELPFINGGEHVYLIPEISTELSLGVIIGTKAKNIRKADALKYVAGYCTINDLSEREFQAERSGQWTKGKSYDTFGPIGPWLVTSDEVKDPQKLHMWLDLNGKRVQDGSTSTMVFGVAHIVAYLSQFFTLMPGDIITTGTPPGVGMGMKPQRFLKPGDTMRLGIEGLGEQGKKVVRDK